MQIGSSSPVSPTARWLALLALATVPTVGCAHKAPPSFQETFRSEISKYQSRISEVVKDPARADKLVALTSTFEQLVLDKEAEFRRANASLDALNARYGATRAEFESVLEQQQRDRVSLLEKLVSLRMEMAASCTDAEWEDLKDYRMDALEDVVEVQKS